jgi:hypothetical protein
MGGFAENCGVFFGFYYLAFKFSNGFSIPICSGLGGEFRDRKSVV